MRHFGAKPLKIAAFFIFFRRRKSLRVTEVKKYIIPLCLGNTDLYKDKRLNLPIELQRIQSFIWEDKDKVDNVILELTK